MSSISIALAVWSSMLSAARTRVAGGVVEYVSLVSGYRTLLLIVAALYLAALVARQTQTFRPRD